MKVIGSHEFLNNVFLLVWKKWIEYLIADRSLNVLNGVKKKGQCFLELLGPFWYSLVLKNEKKNQSF